MADETAPLPSLPADDGGAGAGGGPGGPGAPWWRWPLVAALVAVPLLAGAGGARLGCDAGALDLPVCGPVDAPVSAAEADLEVGQGQTVVAVTDPAGAPVAVIREPAATFPGQFLKFVVTAPDNSRVLY